MKLGPELRDVPRDFPNPHLGETPWRTGRFGIVGGAAFGALLLLLGGCGYTPVYGGGQPKYEVLSGESSTASFEAMQDAVQGVRAELASAEALGSGPARVTVEILRIDERSLGVRSMGDGSPLARGAEITVVGRARVYDKPEGPARLDTGDVSRAAQYASGSSPSADAAARSRAVRDAARSLGKALGRAVLGLPEPAEG